MRRTSPKLLSALAFLLAVAVVPALAQQGPPPGRERGGRGRAARRFMGPQMRLHTPAFRDGGTIPVRYTCSAGAAVVSPRVSWTNPPAATKSFTLLLHDADAHIRGQLEDITHWIIFNIPADSKGLPEGVKADAPATVGVQGKNTRGAAQYMGPCAPPGPSHHYILELYSLNTTLNLPTGASRADIMKAMRGHVLAGTVYVGLFHRARPNRPGRR